MGKDVFSINFSSGITTPVVGDENTDFNGLLLQAEDALKKAVTEGGGKIVRYQSAESPVAEQQSTAQSVSSNMEAILAELSNNEASITDEQLHLAMRKILPLISCADKRLRLGLSKVVLHLEKRLKLK
jgi:hypothetical protein